MHRPHRWGRQTGRTTGGSASSASRRATASAAGLVVAVAAVAGCAGESQRRTIAAATVDGKPGFSPQTITVHTGDEVELIVSNATDRTHGFDIEGYGLTERVVDPTLKPEQLKFTARRAGTFKIYCQLHPQHLTATLVVL